MLTNLDVRPNSMYNDLTNIVLLLTMCETYSGRLYLFFGVGVGVLVFALIFDSVGRIYELTSRLGESGVVKLKFRLQEKNRLSVEPVPF
jgi:hypothetical protein